LNKQAWAEYARWGRAIAKIKVQAAFGDVAIMMASELLYIHMPNRS